MEPLLKLAQLFSLVIALGGIATGIGAIWTAAVTRRLARATEQSLDAQSQHLHEQNERGRINLEADLMYKLQERFNSPLHQNYRRKSLRNCLVKGETPLQHYIFAEAGHQNGTRSSVWSALDSTSGAYRGFPKQFLRACLVSNRVRLEGTKSASPPRRKQHPADRFYRAASSF
jgi:hypothetical protein